MAASEPNPDEQREPVARLRSPLPTRLRIGGGTAIRIEGTVSAADQGLRVRLGGRERPVDGVARSGAAGELLWWAVLAVPAGTPAGPADVALIAGGSELPLGSVELEAGAPPEAREAREGLIAICMATHEPRPEWLARQVDSIRAQSWEDWICLISDDASSGDSFAALEQVVAGDPRFVVSRSTERLGFYANFERALAMVPPEAGLVALADQDDRWDPDKLQALHETLAGNPRALLAYSDMRIAAEDGTILADTYWYLGRNASDDIASQMVNNAVTGAASLFRRELLATALPFPPRASDDQYHDHWLGLCALARGELAFLDRPTYDYTRHGQSVTLQADAPWTAPPRGALGRVAMHWRRWTRRLRMGTTPLGWRDVYFDRYLMIRQLVAVLELRLGDRIEPAKRRALARLAAAERSPRAAGWLIGRTLRPLIGRNETLGRERVLLGSLLWRRLAAARARRG